MPQSKLIKAILLNIFVIPGSGHYVFKRRLRGSLLLAITLCIVIALVAHLTIIIQQQLMVTVTATQDFAKAYQMAQSLSRSLLSQNIGMIKTYMYLLVSCYLFGIGDLVWIYARGKQANSL